MMVSPTPTPQSNFLSPSPRRASVSIWGVLACALGLAVAAWAAVSFFGAPAQPTSITPILAEVTRGEFVAQVLDQGEIQSSENVEIRCRASARNGELKVLTTIPEGTHVEEGDFLIQLDIASFEKELAEQKILLTKALTTKIQAEAKLETAIVSLEEYVKGTYVEAYKTIENEEFDAKTAITTAKQELKQAEAVYEHSKKLSAKAYITQQALEAAGFAVERARLGVGKGENMLALAKEKLKVLKDITSKKFTVQYKSEIRSAEVDLNSQEETYIVESEKLSEIKSQMKLCTIKVPPGISGQVVYSEESLYGNDWTLEEGAVVRENQILIRLPNPKKMEVKALVNEQSITQIKINMPAEIRVDAFSHMKLKGVVTKVNQYAERSGWMSSRVRKYAVLVRIVNPPNVLRPGMNASVSIQTQYAPEGILAPIQTVYGVQDKQFCLAKIGENKWETLEVKTGGQNSQMVLFESGVEVGTQLVMNPAAYKQYMDLPEFQQDSRIELSDADLESIGKTSDETQSAKNASSEEQTSSEKSSADAGADAKNSRNSSHRTNRHGDSGAAGSAQ